MYKSFYFLILSLLIYSCSNKELLTEEELSKQIEFNNFKQAITDPSDVIKLNLKDNEVDSFLNNISLFENLQWLKLESLKLDTLPSVIDTLKMLQYLNLGNCNLMEVPSSVGSLSNLKWLFLENNRLTELSESIRNLKYLKTLTIDKNYFQEEEFNKSGGWLKSLAKASSDTSQYKLLSLDELNILKKEYNEAKKKDDRGRLFIGVYSERKDLYKIKNLKNIQDLGIYSELYYVKDYLPYCRNLQQLVIVKGELSNESVKAISTLKNLKKLELVDVRVLDNSNFEKLSKLSNLEYIRIVGEFNIKEISVFKHVKTIEIKQNYMNLEELFNQLSLFPNLTEVIIEYYFIDEIPENISKLKNIKKLSINRQNVSKYYLDVPASISTLTKLEELTIRKANLPEEIKELKSLKSLSIPDYHQFQEIISDIPNLEKLDISESEIKKPELLVKTISRIKKLKELNLEYIKIAYRQSIPINFDTIPQEFFELKNLKTLKINKSVFSQFYKEIIRNFKQLEHLDLSGNNIDSLPEHISELKKLKTLNLCRSYVKHIPKGSLNGLKKLEVLDLSENPLISLDGNLRNLQSLKELHLEFVPLKSLPQELYNLNNLEYLDISHLYDPTGNTETYGEIPKYALSSRIKNLHKLKVLKINHSTVKVPKEIVELKQLELLEYSKEWNKEIDFENLLPNTKINEMTSIKEIEEEILEGHMNSGD